MASNAISSTGTLLEMGDGASPEVFTAIAEVRSINGPSLTRNVIDVSHHSSGPTGWEDVLMGIKRTGEMSLTISFVPTDATHNGATGLLAAWKNNTKKNFKLKFPDTGVTTWTFAGYVKDFGVTGADVDNALTAEIAIKVSGAITIP